MTTPDVPIRFEIEIEVPGTPDQVWAAIATAEGLSAWFVPTDVDGRVGGRLVTHMGPDADIPADITGWEPPHRFAYEEDLATLVGRDAVEATPLSTEFLVEARSGGTCVVRVVSSAFGTGADWEREFVDQVSSGYAPFFDQLRVYLQHFPGQRATTFAVARAIPGGPEAAQAAVRAQLAGHATGDRIELGETSGVVERVEPVFLVRLEAPVPGMLRVASDGPPFEERTEVTGYLFPPDGTDAGRVVEEQRATWAAFLEDLAVEARR